MFPYVSVTPTLDTALALHRVVRTADFFPGIYPVTTYHTTLVYNNKVEVDRWEMMRKLHPTKLFKAKPKSFQVWDAEHMNLVLTLESEDLQRRAKFWNMPSDYPSYNPHITVGRDPWEAHPLLDRANGKEVYEQLVDKLNKHDWEEFEFVLTNERLEGIDDDE